MQFFFVCIIAANCDVSASVPWDLQSWSCYPNECADTHSEARLSSWTLLQCVSNKAEYLTAAAADELRHVQDDMVGYHGHWLFLDAAQADVAEFILLHTVAWGLGSGCSVAFDQGLLSQLGH
jgi:hypothetical protein